jgi:uncharacterized protein YjiS (DUF1127 family)
LLIEERIMSLSHTVGAVAGCERTVLGKRSTSPYQRALTALTASLKTLSVTLRHRRELEQLARFSDRELRDLAVTRNDVDFALAEPLWRDPAASFSKARSGCAGQNSKS